MAHLPEYVWLVEFQDRRLRPKRGSGEALKANVIAEVVLDATSHDKLPRASLASSVSLSKDATEQTTGEWQADGPGQPWQSLISGRPTRGTATP
jgi:hypothetical protein